MSHYTIDWITNNLDCKKGEIMAFSEEKYGDIVIRTETLLKNKGLWDDYFTRARIIGRGFNIICKPNQIEQNINLILNV